MARTESRTKTAIWSNGDFCQLGVRAQRMYWLLYSQPTISLCGTLALTVRRWAACCADDTPDGVTLALKELEAAGFVLVDFDTEEVLVRTFATHDGVGKSLKTLHAAYRQLAGIASARLRVAARDGLRRLGPPPDDLPTDTPPDTPSFCEQPCGQQGPDTPSDTPSDTPPDRHRVHAYAASVPSLRPLSPDSSLRPLSPGDEPPPGDGTGATHGTRGPGPTAVVALAERLLAACKPNNVEAAQVEAGAVVSWALRHVDRTLVDEAIGWAESKRDSYEPVRLPRAVAKVIHSKGVERTGRAMPEFEPPTMRSA